MSKSLNIFVPALGGAALILGVAYGLAARDSGASQIETLQTRLAQTEARAAGASEKLSAETERAAALAAEVEAVRAAAAERAAIPASRNAPAPQGDGRRGLGRAALPEEIAAWDVKVMPDGRGLPEGSGDVFTGEEVFAEKCAACHGDFAEGVDNWPVLAGGFDTLADEDPVKTVGSYWPHLSTVWDYVHRSMPFGEAGTLTADETYAIVAYILYSNDLVDDEFELNRDSFAEFRMHNAEGFVIDDRADREYAAWSAAPCMENCKPSVQITRRATFLDVTPEGGGESVMNHASADDAPTFTASAAPAQDTAAEASDPAGVSPDPALLAAGEKVFKKCKACHAVGAGAKNRTGPELNGVLGRTMGSVDGFKYSAPFLAAKEEGRVWDEAALAAFLAKPKAYMKGTKMSFSGLKKPADIAAITAYLGSFSP